MKKIILFVIIVLLVAIGAVYLFFPGNKQVVASMPVKAALPGVYRIMSADSNWKKWWPSSTAFQIYDYQFKIEGHIFNAFDISIKKRNDSLISRIDLAFIKADSMSIGWTAQINTGRNPFNRILKVTKAKEIEKHMSLILTALKNFLEKTENIYGFHISETTVKDSVLISTRSSFKQSPSVNDIDGIIQNLRKYIVANGAEEKNFPMLNILKAEEDHYEVMVAIPVDRKLPETNEFAPKFMLKGGYILEAEINGGLYSIEKAFAEFENYRSDHKYTSPAIPYQLLVTDRTKEADTAKWITKLYYPVF